MDAFQTLDRFYFHDYQIFDQEVDSEAAIEMHVSINKRQSLLPLDAEATVGWFECQARLASRLQHPRADFPMD